MIMSIKTSRKYNIQYIPLFESETKSSVWNVSADDSKTFSLFSKNNDGGDKDTEYFVNKTNSTLYNNSNTFKVHTRLGNDASLFNYLRLESLKISVHPELYNFFNLPKLRIASSKERTVVFKDFILKKNEADQTYTLDVPTTLDIDIRQELTGLFTFFVNTVQTLENEASFTQNKLVQNVSESVLFHVEITGRLHNNESTTDNRNILHTYLFDINEHRINIIEFLKKITIFRQSFDFKTYSENINIASLDIKNIIVSYIGRPDKKIKLRKYDIGNGNLLDIKVRSGLWDSTRSELFFIQNLEVVGGVFTSYKVLDDPQEVFQTFYLIIHPDFVHLLPNPDDNRLFVLDGPRTDAIVINSNPLTYLS